MAKDTIKKQIPRQNRRNRAGSKAQKTLSPIPHKSHRYGGALSGVGCWINHMVKGA